MRSCCSLRHCRQTLRTWTTSAGSVASTTRARVRFCSAAVSGIPLASCLVIAARNAASWWRRSAAARACLSAWFCRIRSAARAAASTASLPSRRPSALFSVRFESGGRACASVSARPARAP